MRRSFGLAGDATRPKALAGLGRNARRVGAGLALATAFGLGAAAPLGAGARPSYVETPGLRALVDEGKLPPVAKRVPMAPMVASLEHPWQQSGRHGGTLKMLMGSSRDTRMLVVYGYARLVSYDPSLRLRADVLEGFDVEDGRRFTLRLRKGHRWSDGHPFTAEDFRYYWEDIANNPELSPIGPPRPLLHRGEKARFEVVDETTVRFTWSQPNPEFLPALAGPSPLYIYVPAHYLKRFNPKYADPRKVAQIVKDTRRRNWAELHNRLDNQYRNDNPDLPTLEPWVARTRPPSQRFEFVRNPYYYRVDPSGRQLPYIDRVVLNIAEGRVIPLKTGSGESDLQARDLQFNNYPFLKAAEKRLDQTVRLWRTAKGAHLALYPNLNVTDPGWRALVRDVRFRRALSLAINRYEINRVVYFGLALESGNTVLPGSPLFRPEYQKAWTAFDIRQANALLDEIGLTRRDSRGIRLLPDGRPMEVVVETAGEDSEQTDVLELVHDSWHRVGIKLFSRPSQREVFRNRIFAGETVMSIWSGLENGLPNADWSPEELAPTSQQQLQWPKWGQHHETRGVSGEPIDMPAARELFDLKTRWDNATAPAEREATWHRMLAICADNVFAIGLVAGVLQPVVVSNQLRNVPIEGIYNWNPGAHFGIYKPDSFWIESPETRENG
jgi:peptide/nickel transport system substrate-binding protein